jgi:hypothetical protein
MAISDRQGIPADMSARRVARHSAPGRPGAGRNRIPVDSPGRTDQVMENSERRFPMQPRILGGCGVDKENHSGLTPSTL